MTMMEDTKTDWPTELERLAREAETEALAKADEIFTEAVAEHERQTAGYRFECRRWGDFLTVCVERDANRPSWSGAEPERKIATSLNLGEVREIRLSDGHCFDRRGTVEYRASYVSDDGESSGWGTGFGRMAPQKGYHYAVSPDYPYVPKSRPMIAFEKKKDREHFGHCMGMSDYQPRHITKDYPRPAKDDEIRFLGIGTTIYAPAGKGRAVYDAIMVEIARGYEPATLPVKPLEEG